MLIAILDGTLSSLITCHPASSHQPIGGQKPQECPPFMGPVLLTLEWIVAFFDEHGDLAVAAFTAVLAVFTGRLWFSTEKLWNATRMAAERQETDTRILQRAYLTVERRG